jgi:hypothetical protein
MNRFILISVYITLGSCIGVDYIDDPVVGARIELSPSLLALKVNESASLSAKYYDQYGIMRPATFIWTSSAPDIATVDANGFVLAQKEGQASIVASHNNVVSNSLTITVVVSAAQVAKVIVSSSGNKTSLQPGESIQLTASVRNINDEELSGKVVQWFSENAGIASVSSGGRVTGVSKGMVDIHAKADGVKSNVVKFSIGVGRSGTFVPAGGYQAEGMATMKEEGGKIILEFSSDFKTSFALGTFVYMADVTNGSQVRASGLEVAQITTNGAKSFDLTAVKPNIKLQDYKYVIILCKPASVTFGYAEMK